LCRAWPAAILMSLAALALADVDVVIRDYRFDPPQLTVKIGATVNWKNEEKRTSHSVYFLGPDGFESERLFPGESWSRRFERAGRYPYHCGPHPEMTGVVEVVD
jgi:plastocyanin